MKAMCCVWVAVAALVSACAVTTTKALPPRVRTLAASGPERFHRPVTLQVGWQSYQEQVLLPDGDDRWQGAAVDSSLSGYTPVLVLHYLDDDSRITLPMDIDDALLGRLLKFTAMTERPVEKPLQAYLEQDDCTHCHPSTIALD